MLLRRHRGELLADFVRFYGATPYNLWRRGMHLLDVAALAANLPPDGAVARLDDLHEWRPLATQVAVAAVNDIRLLRQQVSAALGGKFAPEMIRPPDEQPQGSDDTRVDRIGASEGFNSFAEADAWYRSKFPDARI